MKVYVVSPGIECLELEVPDDHVSGFFVPSNGVCGAKQYLLDCMTHGTFQERPDWKEDHINGQLEISIPELNLEYILVGNINPQLEQERQQQRKKGPGTRWSRHATLTLIKLWRERKSRFENSTERNDSLWEEICSEMGREGLIEFTALQCENKFKYLKKTYMETKDKNLKSTGQPEATCPYYDEMEEIFQKSPLVRPLSLCSNREGVVFSQPSNQEHPATSSCPYSEQASTSAPQEVEASSPSPSRRTDAEHVLPSARPEGNQPKRSRLESALASWGEKFEERAIAREASRQKRHEETIKIIKETNEIFKNVMEKLIEKL